MSSQSLPESDSETKYQHTPVMISEVLEALKPVPGGVYVDATLGLAGHTRAIAEKLTGETGKTSDKKIPNPNLEQVNRDKASRIIGIDLDQRAIEIAKTRLKRYGELISYIQANFRDINQALKLVQVDRVDGILADLGVSSMQLEHPGRGFSFGRSEFLDMRMNQPKNQALNKAEWSSQVQPWTSSIRPVSIEGLNPKAKPGEADFTAANLINFYSARQIKLVLDQGEAPYAGQIARAIERRRAVQPIVTTSQLVEVIRSATPPSYRYSRTKTHFATAVFRALRLAVNDELEALKDFLAACPQLLLSGGRVALISFHSLEDRLVKHSFRAWQDQGLGQVLSQKPILPCANELEENPKARSAKLRVFERW